MSPALLLPTSDLRLPAYVTQLSIHLITIVFRRFLFRYESYAEEWQWYGGIYIADAGEHVKMTANNNIVINLKCISKHIYLAALTGMHAIVEATGFVATYAAQHRGAVKFCNKINAT